MLLGRPVLSPQRPRDTSVARGVAVSDGFERGLGSGTGPGLRPVIRTLISSGIRPVFRHGSRAQFAGLQLEGPLLLGLLVSPRRALGPSTDAGDRDVGENPAAIRVLSLEREEEETRLMLGLFCDRALKSSEAAADKTELFRAMVKSSVPRELVGLPATVAATGANRDSCANVDTCKNFEDGCVPWSDDCPRRPFAFYRSPEQERSCRLVRRLNELLHAKRVEITEQLLDMLRARDDRGQGGPRELSRAERARAVTARFESGASEDAAETTSWYISHPSAELEYWKTQNGVCAALVGELRKYAADMRSVDEL